MSGFNHLEVIPSPHPVWALFSHSVHLMVLFVFLTMTLWPGRALAFTSEMELGHLPLLFERDSALADQAIVGSEPFRAQRTVSGLLQSPALTVRLSLSEGSTVRVLATAYSPSAEETDASPLITASGDRVGPSTMAANFLPLGTKVRMGGRLYTVLDRLNSRYDDKYIIDVWQPTQEDALAFGARMVEIEIVVLP